MGINVNLLALRAAESKPFPDRIMEAALVYARNGGVIVPLIPNTKMPAMKEWQNFATNDEATIRRWFGPGGEHRGGNIALLINDFKVVDIDIHGEANGFRTLSGALDKVPCPRAKTPNNGEHLLATKTDVRHDPKNGVEVLEDGKLFTVYPSEIDGRRYLWTSGGDPSPVNRIRAVESDVRGPTQTAVPLAPIAYVRTLLEHVDPDVDYGTWLKVGMAIHQNDAGEAGLIAYDEWSRGGLKYKEGEPERRWATFDANRTNGVSLRWLIIEAVKNGKHIDKEDILYHGNLYNSMDISKVNEKYGLFDMNGEMLVVYKERGAIHFASPYNFRIKIGDWKTEAEGKLKPMSDIWLDHPERRIVTEVGMWMPGEEPEGAMNSYEGFAVSPVKCEEEEISLFLNFCQQEICRGNEAHYKFLMDMLAKKIQNPMALLKLCLVLRGGEGVGKGALTRVMENIIGPKHATNVSSAESWLGKYSGAILKSSIWLSANEAYWSGNHTQSERLKALVTEEMLDLEEKFVNIRKQRNRLMIAITTNNKWAVPAGHDSRRYFVLDVANTRAKDPDFWDEFHALMGADEATGKLHNPEYLGKILYWFQKRKIRSNLKWALETNWLQEQRRESAIESREEAFIMWVRTTFVNSGYEDIVTGGGGTSFPILQKMDGAPVFRVEKVFEDYRNYINKNHKKPRMAYTLASFIENMEPLGFEAKRVVKDRLTMGGRKPPDAKDTGSKVLTMRLPSPDQIEDNITKHFALFEMTTIGEEE